MRRFLVLTAIALFIFVQRVHAAETKAPSRPNVLFIAIDDLRDWVGYLGHNPQTRTPNIDRLAARGVAFTRSYCAAPVCNASRAALMSGLRPSTTGVYENNADWRPAVPENLTLCTTFRNAGYYVAGSGKIYHEAYKRRSEWDDYLDKEGPSPSPAKADLVDLGGLRWGPVDCKDEDLADYRIVSYAIEQLQKPHDKPMFLACGLHKPHLPWFVPRKYFDEFPLDQIQLPPHIDNDLDDVPAEGVRLAHKANDHKHVTEAGKWKDAVRAYLAATAYTDMNIGRLLDAFDKSPYRDNTIICLWCDHGWHLGEKEHWRKFALWEEATRSPLIWVVPGVTQPHGVCERTVDFMTLYPTLCDLCNIPIPKHVEGPSIRSLLANPSAEWATPALMTYLRNNHAVRSERWRYIHYFDGGEELYDHATDPNEWTNLANKPELAPVKADLAKLFPTTNHADLGRKGSKRGEEER
ncbi:MAG TPA: sulfatase [Tepidisphaeraceae bacterium]|jgi:arylsulfatase A-like enzyme|nr:sulfatase [Tepidisphaeraceae bacterium]